MASAALPLSGKGFFLAGFPAKERVQIADSIKRLGGDLYFSISKTVSFVVALDAAAAQQVKIPRQCDPVVVSADFIDACASANALVAPHVFRLNPTVAPSAAATPSASADWLRIESLEAAQAEEEAAVAAKALKAAEELAARQREEQRLMALQPPAVKRVVMGRDGQIKYIYKDNKQLIVQPTHKDHLLSQLDEKAKIQRATMDATALEAKRSRAAEKKRDKKKRSKLAKASLQSSVGEIDSTPVRYAWSFSLLPSSKALNSVLGIEVDESSTRGVGPFRIKSQNLTSIRRVSCGPMHSAFIDKSGKVLTWGVGTKFRLGHGPAKKAATPTLVPLPCRDVVDVSCGFTHTAAVDSNGKLYVWGTIGSMIFESPSLIDHQSSNVSRVWCGKDTVAFTAGDKCRLFMFGANDFGQCGVGTNARIISEPRLVAKFQSPVKQIALGRSHSVALLESGQVFVWGSGDGGACGNSRQEKHLSPFGPLKFSTKSPIAKISCSNQRTLCFSQDGSVFLFGRGESGCPDVLEPLQLSIPSVSTPKDAFLADCGASTEIVVQDRSNRVSSFPWGSCSFLPDSGRVLAPSSTSESLRSTLPLSLESTELSLGFLHGVVVLSSTEDLIMQYAIEGDLQSLQSTLSTLTQTQKQALEAYRDGQGNSLLHAATMCLHSSHERSVAILREILASFPSRELLNAQNNAGKTVLHVVATQAKVELTRMLISTGLADVDTQDSDGNTALHCAVAAISVLLPIDMIEKKPAYDAVMQLLIIDGVCALDIRNSQNLNVTDYALSLDLIDLAYKLNTLGSPVSVAELQARGLDWWLSILGAATDSFDSSLIATTSSKSSVWICHSNSDFELASKLQKSLIRSGVKATCDFWKFNPQMHTKSVVVSVFIITDASLRDERCIAELHQSITESDGVAIGIVCQDLTVPVTSVVSRLLRRVIYAVDQTPAAPTQQAALQNSETPTDDYYDDRSDTSFFTDDASSEQAEESSAEPALREPKPTIHTVPAEIVSKLKNTVSQLLSQDRQPSKRASTIPSLAVVLDRCEVSESRLLQPEKFFFSSSLQDRSVRIFVSSTFRDMQQERELLVTQIFPHIERYCLDRHIAFSFVDLRWGITDEMSSTGQVLTTCLREVDRSYPYFLCMLGERYGWHDMSDVTSVKDELLERTFDNAVQAGFDWVDRFRTKSITELEVIYGALRYIPSERLLSFGEPIDYGYDVSDDVKEAQLKKLNAFFYLRDPSFADSVKSKHKELYAAENFLAKAKMAELRNTIRSSELPWKGYKDMEAFQTHVLEDFIAAINRQFSDEHKPTPTEEENLRHIALAKSHLSIHTPRWQYLNSIHQHVNSASKIEYPLLLWSPERGMGSSAMMAYAASYYANLNPNKLVFFHFTRASDQSTLYYEIQRRIIVAIHDHYDIKQPVPVDKDEIAAEFSGWLQLASERGGMLIFIDGLDQMPNVDGSESLDWLPKRFPTNVRTVVSGSFTHYYARDKWSQKVQIQYLSFEERTEMVRRILSLRGKTLSPEQMHTIVRHEPCNQASFLKTLLDALLNEGVYDTLNDTIEKYLRARSTSQLSDMIVSRWCSDFGQAFVIYALGLIGVSRQGLSEYELLDILKCSHADWNRLYVAVKDSLVNRAGLLQFSNDDILQAVRGFSEYNVLPKRLANYFWQQQQESQATTGALSRRVIVELPYQLRKLEAWEWLYMSLTDMRMFDALYTDEFMFDLITYWRLIEEAHAKKPLNQDKMTAKAFHSLNTHVAAASNDIVLASFRIAAAEYSAVSSPADRKQGVLLYKAGEFCREIAKYDASLTFYLQGVEIQRKLVQGISDMQKALSDVNEEGQSVIEELAMSYDGLAFLEKTRTRYADAAKWSLDSLATLENLPMNKSVAYCWVSALCNYSNILGKQVKLDESERVGKRAVDIARAHLPSYDPEVARAINCWSVSLKKLKRFADAEPLALESLKLRERVCGPNHTFVSYSLMNVGNIYAKLKRFNDAVAAYERMYRITCECHGQNHPQGAQAKYSLGKLYLKFGYNDQAKANLNTALEIALRVYGHNHALTKKIYMKILDMLGYEESENKLLDSISRTLHRFVEFGLATQTLIRTPEGVLIGARVDRKQVEAASIGVQRSSAPAVVLYPKGYFARLEALEEAKRNAQRAPVVEDPFESSDEDMKEEAEFESSDEDMGFCLFD